MVFITSDNHRKFTYIEKFCAKNDTTTSDILIILGDAGINYFGNPQDLRLKEKLSKLPITLFCIHGNHENRPENIGTYEEVEQFSGLAYMESDFPNLIFTKDGEVYDFNGKRCLVIGGAYSVDKFVRIQNNWPWWSDEQPSAQTKRLVENRLEVENWNVDIVFSHTCPMKYMPYEAFLGGIDQRMVDKSTEEWLDSIEDKLTYSKWFCGHFHIEKVVDKMRFVYQSFYELVGL